MTKFSEKKVSRISENIKYMSREDAKLVFIPSDMLKKTKESSKVKEKKTIIIKPDKYKKFIFEKEKPIYFQCTCIRAIFPARLVFTKPNIQVHIHISFSEKFPTEKNNDFSEIDQGLRFSPPKLLKDPSTIYIAIVPLYSFNSFMGLNFAGFWPIGHKNNKHSSSVGKSLLDKMDNPLAPFDKSSIDNSDDVEIYKKFPLGSSEFFETFCNNKLFNEGRKAKNRRSNIMCKLYKI